MTISIILCAFFLIVPSIFIHLKNKGLLRAWLSPVVLCYLTGIIFGNSINISPQVDVSNKFCELSILIAIPMILFSLDIFAWFKLAKKTILAFVLCIISVGLSVSAAVVIFFDQIDNVIILGGMLAGCYTGGTPNLNAVGLAYNAAPSLFPLANTSDAIVSGIYLLFLTTIAKTTLSVILPNSKLKSNKPSDLNSIDKKAPSKKINEGVKGFLASICCVIISLLLSWMLYQEMNSMFIIITITLTGIIFSTIPFIHKAVFSYDIGQYLLLSFCVAIGFLSNLDSLFNDSSGVLLFTSLVLFLSVALHMLLCMIFRIDTDTAIITSTAGVFGPPFIGQVAEAINNRQIIITGMITGVIGLAFGNFYGIFVIELLNKLF